MTGQTGKVYPSSVDGGGVCCVTRFQCPRPFLDWRQGTLRETHPQTRPSPGKECCVKPHPGLFSSCIAVRSPWDFSRQSCNALIPLQEPGGRGRRLRVGGSVRPPPLQRVSYDETDDGSYQIKIKSLEAFQRRNIGRECF